MKPYAYDLNFFFVQTDCTLAYNLLLRVPNGLKPMLAMYEDYIAKRGKGILEKLGSGVAKVWNSHVEILLFYV